MSVQELPDATDRLIEACKGVPLLASLILMILDSAGLRLTMRGES